MTGNPVEIYDSLTSGEGLRANLLLKKADYKGMGVFAGKPFAKGELIEMCHSILLEWQSKYQRDASISRYAYAVGCHCDPSLTRPPCMLNCPVNGHRYMIPLGFGACYNSADSEEGANAKYDVVPDRLLIFYTATKDISEGEEIVTWFGKGFYDAWCKAAIPKKGKK